MLSHVQSTDVYIEGILCSHHSSCSSLVFLSGSFLGSLSLCLHCPSAVCSCVLSVLSFGALSIFIVVILNCQSDNSDILAVSGSGAYSLFLNFVFLPFGIPDNFLLIAGNAVPGKRNFCRQTFINVVRCGEGRCSVVL